MAYGLDLLMIVVELTLVYINPPAKLQIFTQNNPLSNPHNKREIKIVAEISLATYTYMFFVS